MTVLLAPPTLYCLISLPTLAGAWMASGQLYKSHLPSYLQRSYGAQHALIQLVDEVHSFGQSPASTLWHLGSVLLARKVDCPTPVLDWADILIAETQPVGPGVAVRDLLFLKVPGALVSVHFPGQFESQVGFFGIWNP
jgi:hypothetical protein